MKITKDQLEIFIFYVGIARSELNELKKMVASFEKKVGNQFILNIMDMSKATFAKIEKGEILWQQPRAYTEWVKPNVTPEDTDAMFAEFPAFVNRIESEEYEMRAVRTNRAVKSIAKTEYTLLLDSDMELITSDLIGEINSKLEYQTENRFGVMTNIINPLPFGIGEIVWGSRRMDIYKWILNQLEKLTHFVLSKRMSQDKGSFANYDTQGIRRKGSFPRFDPAFMLVNREKVLKNNILFDTVYLDIDDYSSGQYQEWRILGDEGAVIYEFAKHGLSVVNIDYMTFIEHKFGSWQSIQKKNLNWYYIGREYEKTDRGAWY